MIGEKVKELREQRGLDVKELAILAGLTPGCIYHIETGRRLRPETRTLSRLARVLRVPVAQLIDEETAR